MNGNRLCHLLDIQYPIVQAPMNWISGADLAAAVSNAGGLGTIGPNGGAVEITSDVAETGKRLRNEIKKAKSLTDKPFAVNLPIGMDDRGREFSQQCVAVAKEEGIRVAITSVGPPNVYTEELKDASITVLHAVSTPRHARKAEKCGVDGVICEGYEGGGHKSITGLTTMTMIPMTADAVKIPILAAGGIADARGVAAAMVLGADGVYMGTRFMATNECDAHQNVKNALIEGQDACTTAIKKWIVTGRNLTNAFTQKYTEMQESGASTEELMQMIAESSMHNALVLGDTDQGELPCGQIAGLIDNRLAAAEIIRGILTEIPTVIEALQMKLAPINMRY